VNEWLQRLRQRKLVQWAIAYIAASFALIQVLEVVADSYAWPRTVMHLAFGVLALGFVLALLLAWYHGERGEDRISGPELLLIALVLAIGGGLLWHFGRGGSQATAARNTVAAAGGPDAAKRTAFAGLQTRTAQPARRVSDMDVANNPGVAIQDSAAGAAAAQAAPIPAKSIAVLPFENLSNDKDNEYFVAGMQDLILTKLADIGDLKVISRTSTEKYKSRPQDLKIIGRQLGVATILEGSVQKAGDEVLINVQLIDAKTDTHVWAQDYQRKLADIFGVEGEVAGKIAAALDARLSPAETAQLDAVPTTNSAAYDLLLRANYDANRGDTNYDTASWKAAIPLYRKAIASDPGLALAYARLSYVESILGWFGGGGEDPRRLVAQASTDAKHALKLAPDLPAARIAIGYSDYYGARDYDAALEAFDAALALRPNDADALAARGYVERRQGRFDDAIASLTRALAHDPRNGSLAYEIGYTCMMAAHYADAEPWFQRALALDPTDMNAKVWRSQAILLDSGDIARAVAAAAGDAPALKIQRVSLLSMQRRQGEAVALLDSIPDSPDIFSVGIGSKALLLAELYRLSGNTAKARPLFVEALAAARVQLGRQRNLQLAGVWQHVASAELGLGRTAAGLAAIGKAQRIVAASRDQTNGPVLMKRNAALYAEARRADLAVPLLAKALAKRGLSYVYSPLLLWIDPTWDPIRDDPRFRALLKQYAGYEPAAARAVAAAGSVVSASTR
jgi:TolB-like protein